MRELVRRRTDYQDVCIFETESHGRVLALDGAVQITEADEFVYQEMLAHVPLIAHGSARRVLIIGGGDGGVLRRVLEHRTVTEVTMVEIDGEVVELAKQYLPDIAGASWQDARARIVIGDGLKYVSEVQQNSLDVIIVDSTDPAGVGEVLFTDRFYADCARALGEHGIVVNQSGVPFMQADELRQTSRRRAAAFPHVTAYVAAVPTYVGGFMTLGLASKSAAVANVTREQITTRAEQAGILGRTRYWSPAIHQAAFVLPPYIAALLEPAPAAGATP